MEFTKNGGAAIQAMIDAACENGSRQAHITGNYEIEKTILIPSDFTLILENCHLVMADDTFCNMFRNVRAGTDAGKTAEGGDRNIIIEGRGRVILDGGNYNGLSERNSEKDGRPHITVNNILLCGGSIAVGVVVYFVSVVLFKAITADDCKLLPKGEKIAKILRL